MVTMVKVIQLLLRLLSKFRLDIICYFLTTGEPGQNWKNARPRYFCKVYHDHEVKGESWFCLN